MYFLLKGFSFISIFAFITFPKTFLGPCEPNLAVKKVTKFFQQFYYLVQMGHTQSETDHYVISSNGMAGKQEPFTCTTCAKQDLEQDYYNILLMTFAFNFIYQCAIQLKSIFGRRSEFSSWRLWNEVGIRNQDESLLRQRNLDSFQIRVHFCI